MQFTTIVSILAVAMTAAAAPSGGGGNTVNSCSNQQTQYCCNGLLSCVSVDIIAMLLGQNANCQGQSYCCENNGNQYGIINLDLLNCAQLLS
ncbi:hypothetical protein MMYC01_202394 [Madurella mycetomatis]|uniref:Hydrophobin n=1 Tax=Madurella mycetomatis TaxID=100816 RepID=A0A175W8Q0_9PEZI|nr:hypothetical protein MMYC01_209041 [Madurella mycetomatis]KXX79965.1 hypothetical protein MMYC01_202394 [Madurella mycetomatis]